MTIVGDGRQRRDFTYIDDVVDANICAMKVISNDVGYKVYNVGTGKNYSINEVAAMIGKNVKYISKRPAEVKETLAEINATTKDLGWLPKHDLSKNINSY